MTIQEALDQVDMMKPNMVPPELKVRWLGDLDAMIWRQIVLTHEGTEANEPTGVHDSEHKLPDYDMVTDLGTQLMAPHPYSRMYPLYLAAQIDLANAEIEKYNNDTALFQNSYLEYGDWYNRNHMPRQKTLQFGL